MSESTTTSSPADLCLHSLMQGLQRVDRLIERAVRSLRDKRGREFNDLPGLYVSDAEVDQILSGAYPIGPGLGGAETMDPPHTGGEPALGLLAARFGLTSFDVDALLICLAPELDLSYERTYAYLQDDVMKRRPSVDLVLNLLCPSREAKLVARARFSYTAPLIRHQLLALIDEPSQPQPPLLAKQLRVDERVVVFLLGDNAIDARLLPFAHSTPLGEGWSVGTPLVEQVQQLVSLSRSSVSSRVGMVVGLQGTYGVGKRKLAEAVCRALGLGLVVVDVPAILDVGQNNFTSLISYIAREAILQGAALYWARCDGLLAEQLSSRRDELLREVRALGLLCFLAGEGAWEPAGEWHDLPFAHISLPLPDAATRAQLWSAALADQTQPAEELASLAGRFRLSGGQIRDAAAGARRAALLRNPVQPRIDVADLYAACRAHSSQAIGGIARKIAPRAGWDDLVLPVDQLRQLREVCDHVVHRAVVYDGWGFERRMSRGKGLNVLFAGPSGTGKTMAAEVIAGALGLELYAIDLSAVVSKYIGETEKNLARIFAAAERSNAILFFDEADALFGKRSEVRDSHDRYANIEVGYLLQKMEEYDGVAILATNMRRSLDEAFLRRMQVTVEFPFPGERERRQIWERALPAELPCGPDLDLEFAARQLELAGGNIRNIALAAAFLAAANGQVVTMAHLVQAARREYQKLGKVVLEREFGPYAELLEHYSER